MKIIIALILIGIFLISGCIESENEQLTNYERGWNAGLSRCVDICIESYETMLEQFIPDEGCKIIVYDNHSIEQICEETEYNYTYFNESFFGINTDLVSTMNNSFQIICPEDKHMEEVECNCHNQDGISCAMLCYECRGD